MRGRAFRCIGLTITAPALLLMVVVVMMVMGHHRAVAQSCLIGSGFGLVLQGAVAQVALPLQRLILPAWPCLPPSRF